MDIYEKHRKKRSREHLGSITQNSMRRASLQWAMILSAGFGVFYIGKHLSKYVDPERFKRTNIAHTREDIYALIQKKNDEAVEQRQAKEQEKMKE
mmetsp:Transcript_6236/g.11261  ORF Transcript_6236/g.11261 Transcript_6236/m.11261 type:complete len:95 (+) Transcript_6236:365-649(+)|eukprot:CAMPEP_0184698536 /NCGR_PEP_ID=MMETSP0313-20130426/5134_1 /TAXON_ID=2792 /ORGANISM="Porphyridium aerugineum, Strain SAG 1380-2" /LENGTH=94 /DNA_ID=CAMNT_0027157499 /DNA_START=145 /DNA_END=429 /DNA_ORIENTATION=-